MRFRASDYLSLIYRKPFMYQRLVNRTAKRISRLKKEIKFDAIAFRGASGAALAYPLSAQLRIPIICIRKNASSHGQSVEGPNNDVRRYIIIDDFIDNGKTMRAILQSIDTMSKNKKVECVGIVLYDAAYDNNDRYRDHVHDHSIFLHKNKEIPIYYWG